MPRPQICHRRSHAQLICFVSFVQNLVFVSLFFCLVWFDFVSFRCSHVSRMSIPQSCHSRSQASFFVLFLCFACLLLVFLLCFGLILFSGSLAIRSAPADRKTKQLSSCTFCPRGGCKKRKIVVVQRFKALLTLFCI